MATTGDIVEKAQDVDENATSRDNSMTLEYSGASEENVTQSEANSSIGEHVAQDMHDDLDHGAPVPSVKAVKTDVSDSHMMSDDECPKTLTTLETVKKAEPTTDNDEIEIDPIEPEDDEFEEEPILLEVYNEDEEKEETGDEKADAFASNERKSHVKHLVNNLKAKLSTPKSNKTINDDSIVTPNKPIPTPSAGTIEIPRELITSDESVISPVIIKHNPSDNSEDLIAILEGDGIGSINHDATVEHYELSLPKGKTNGELKLTAAEERKIAMEQMLSLPKKKKGRPKLNQAVKAVRQTKKTKNVALVDSLVSDWDDGKHEHATETEIVVEILPPKKNAIEEPAQPSFRRSRIIKKKIIWDPDAPETAINYASLAHTSGPAPAKKTRKLSVKKSEDGYEEASIEITLPLGPPTKKKKTSEIDKLLGDEGAANMLNSLHQGNNNNNKVDGTSPGKIPRAKAIKAEPCNVQSASILPAKAKATKVKEVKEPSPQKQPPSANKKNATPKGATVGKKRGPKTSDSWDFIYNDRPDDCMIIRRRSNSSYSSTASLNRTSIDLPNAPLVYDLDGSENDHVFETQPKRARSAKDKNFEFAKPRARKVNKSDAKYNSSFDDAKNSSADVFTNHKAGTSSQNDEINVSELPIKLENGNDGDDAFSEITLCRYEHFTQINIQPDDVDSKCLFSASMLKEIESALHSLESDKSCKLVLLSTAGANFCSGLDYSTLVQSTTEKRRISAQELVKKLNNFMLALAAFKKPLVAHVKGVVNGLGARILPLFDVVWAESSSSFSCNSFDEIIEGSALLSATDKIEYNAKMKLLFSHELLDAKEAKECNIVSHVLKDGKANQRVLIECDRLATKSPTVLETFRLTQQYTMLPKLKDLLKIEQKQLLQHWTKVDFLEKLKAS